MAWDIDAATECLRAQAAPPEKGDVAVIQPYPGGNAAGHIAMYDGVQWISDFRQRDMWGGPGYRTDKPSIAICRPNRTLG